MSEWQPIATAPVDATAVLLWSKYCSQPCVCMFTKSEWFVLNEDGGRAKTGEGDTWTEYATFYAPSHWMELPPTPVGDEP